MTHIFHLGLWSRIVRFTQTMVLQPMPLPPPRFTKLKNETCLRKKTLISIEMKQILMNVLRQLREKKDSPTIEINIRLIRSVDWLVGKLLIFASFNCSFHCGRCSSDVCNPHTFLLVLRQRVGNNDFISPSSTFIFCILACTPCEITDQKNPIETHEPRADLESHRQTQKLPDKISSVSLCVRFRRPRFVPFIARWPVFCVLSFSHTRGECVVSGTMFVCRFL